MKTTASFCPRLLACGLIALGMSSYFAAMAAEAAAPAVPGAAADGAGAARGGRGGGRGGAGAPAPAPAPLPASVIYNADYTAGSTIHDRDPGYRPMYLVFADQQRTAEAAKKLVDDLGLTAHAQEYRTRVFVMAPANGNAYDSVTDLNAYRDFLRARRSSNLKIVALGAGATFVNEVIARQA